MSSEFVRDYAALVDLIEARMRAPFAWGKRANDCISFFGAAILAQTGVDRLAALPNWTSQRGALRVLKGLGGLQAAVDGVLTSVPLAQAARGDGGLVETATGQAVMVIEGATLVGPGPTGLVRLPRAAMLRAWSAL
ncbi:hypothetical protein [Caulobacter sp. Root1472]|uniref:DUF6950 family protein n=1 Tax=Caulobacter sp. Root1472 TaxID=1736470 RepID=UPI0006FA13FD|nr:hypothetical protein [Caulobacter sp. Root1472]KQZ31730.1 hypothetical protein ASD47_15780 [Caulobacter sp. Root1472]